MGVMLSRLSSKWFCVAVVLLALVALERPAVSQLPTATILGVVKDASGAVVPAAGLTARNVETGQTRTTVAAADGSYRFSALPVGNYEVRVEQSGFQTAVRSGLTLSVGQEAVVNFTLEVGAGTQTIAVTAEAPLVNTTSGSLGALVDERRLAELPMNGRNYINLTMMQPGVQELATSRVQLVRYGGWYSSSGAPLHSNNYLLDGAPMIGIYGGSPSSASGNTLGVEGIREWRVVTNSFSAEYGMTMGSQMVVVSKSGTNTFHGSLLEYLRNSALDARNFFDYKTVATPRRLPAFTRNNFGGSFGGPIQKDKTFFHAAYEALRERLGISTLLNVISRETKAGAVSPAIRPYLQFFPEPNLPNNGFTFPYTQPTSDNYGQMRVDQTISNNDSLFVRYTVNDSFVRQLLNFPEFLRDRRSRDQFVTLSESHIFSPSLLNTFRVSFSRMTLKNDPTGLDILPPSSWFMSGEGLGSNLRGTGSLTVGGITPWGPDSFSPTFYKKNTFVYSDDLFYTRGRHALKFGALINRYHYSVFNPYFARGLVVFPSVPAFLAAQPVNYRGAVFNLFPDRTYKHTTLGFYLQDDFRVLSNLTLNVGLRYEFSTEFQETHGHATPLRDARNDAAVTVGRRVFENPTLRNFSPRLGFAWDVRGDGRTAVRGGFGLLYDVGNTTRPVIQGICSAPFCSLGVFAPAPGTTLTSFPLTFPPGVLGRSLFGLDYHFQQPHILHYNLTVERQLPGEMAFTLAYAGSRGLNLMQVTDGNPVVPQILPDGRKFWPVGAPRVNPNWGTCQFYTAGGNSWYNALQFSVLKRMSRGLQFQSSYTWSKTMDEPQGQFQGDGTLADPSDRKYDRGLAEFDVAHNWRFNAMYRVPQMARAGNVLVTLLNGWGLSGILSLQTGYPTVQRLVNNRSRSGVLGGANPIDRPDLVPGVKVADITQGVSRGCGTGPGAIPAGTPLGTPERWFDPCAFTLQAPGFLGNAGRNIVRGPGLANLDFSLTKGTPLRFLGESGQLEFRAEFFNILNRVSFSDPGIGTGAATANPIFAGAAPVGVAENPLPTAGQITATRTNARQIQFALKLLF